MWVNWLILGAGVIISVVGMWMTYPYLAASRGWWERVPGTVVGAEYRVRLSEENVERWWRIDVQAICPAGVVTVRVPITAGAAERVARGALEPFPRSGGLKLAFTLRDEVAHERAHFNAQADRLIGRDVSLAVPPSNAPLRPNAIVVDPPARARQALIPLIVLGAGIFVMVPSLVLAIILI
jgi:hypothetical protein